MAASPFNVALLVTALTCVASVVTEVLGPWMHREQEVLPQLMMLGVALAFLAASPRWRRDAAWLLARRSVGGHGLEIAIVAAAIALAPCAISGAAALWHWQRDGAEGLTALLLHQHETEALSPARELLGVYGYAAFAVATPALEELYLRGLLLRSLGREWGWGPAVVACAALGALCESALVPAFAAGLALGALGRRAGCVAAPMLAHACAGAAAPIVAAHWAVPAVAPGHAVLADWAWPIACLVALAASLPFYVRSAQRVAEARPIAMRGAIPFGS